MAAPDARPRLALTWAMARNRVIGVDGGLPWRLPDEMRHFRRCTMGKPVIAGRRTFDETGKPLPGRTNIVVTRQPDWHAAGVLVAHSLQEALSLAHARAHEDGVDEVHVIGGSALYAEALPLADRLYMTLVNAELDGDVYFPEFSLDEFVELERVEHPADERHAFAFTMVTLDRRAS